MKDEIFSGGFQHAQNRCGAAKKVKPAVVGGDFLIGSGAGTEEVTQLVVGAAETASRVWAFEPTHRSIAALNATMILLQPVVEIPAVAVPHILPQGRPNRPRITVVPVRGDPVGRDILADSKNAFAAAMSRCSRNITSTSAPERSR